MRSRRHRPARSSQARTPPARRYSDDPLRTRAFRRRRSCGRGEADARPSVLDALVRRFEADRAAPWQFAMEARQRDALDAEPYADAAVVASWMRTYGQASPG